MTKVLKINLQIAVQKKCKLISYMLQYMSRYAILKIEKGVEMEQEKNKNGVIMLLIVLVIVLAVLCVLFATGTINLKNNTVTEDATNSNTNDVNMINSVVAVKNFEINSVKVVNAPNYHMAIDGKFVLEGNYDDYINVYFYGYCYDADNNRYNIIAPSIGHKYDIGENRLDASEVLDYNYGKQYDLYTDNSDKKKWKEIKFKSCRFDKMTTTLSKSGKTFQISEDINFDKTFN